MALSDRHLIIGTLLACGAIAASSLPPGIDAAPPQRRSAVTKEVRVRQRLATHLRRETATLALLERRDALMRRIGTTDGVGSPIVLHDADVPEALRQLIDAAIADEVASVGGALDGARVAVRVLIDTAAPPAHWGPLYGKAAWIDNQYVLPPATDRRTCLAIVRVGPRVLEVIEPAGRRVPASAPARTMEELRRDIERAVGSFLGPCAFYGAHGLPGQQIEQWLSDAYFSQALRSPAIAADSLPGFFTGLPGTRIARWIAALGWSDNRAYLSSDLVRCTEGDAASCRALLRAPRTVARAKESPWLLRERETRFVLGRPLGPSEAWFMAGLHGRMGPEAFGRFWRSPLEPEQAFSEVMGVTLEDATRDWAREVYDAGRPHTWPHPLALAGQILLVGGLVGTTAFRPRRPLD